MQQTTESKNMNLQDLEKTLKNVLSRSDVLLSDQDFSLPRSDVIAASIRGLSGPTEPEEGKFVYTNSLLVKNENGEYVEREYDDTVKNVKSVTFNISRYAKYSMTIRFDYQKPMTEKGTIEYVEEFLSKPLTEDWFNMVRDDTFHEFTWEEAKEQFVCRGDVLTDAKFLEGTHLSQDGNMTFGIGS